MPLVELVGAFLGFGAKHIPTQHQNTHLSLSENAVSCLSTCFGPMGGQPSDSKLHRSETTRASPIFRLRSA